jgi:hypothetical protein
MTELWYKHKGDTGTFLRAVTPCNIEVYDTAAAVQLADYGSKRNDEVPHMLQLNRQHQVNDSVKAIPGSTQLRTTPAYHETDTATVV